MLDEEKRKRLDKIFIIPSRHCNSVSGTVKRADGTECTLGIMGYTEDWVCILAYDPKTNCLVQLDCHNNDPQPNHKSMTVTLVADDCLPETYIPAEEPYSEEFYNIMAKSYL